MLKSHPHQTLTEHLQGALDWLDYLSWRHDISLDQQIYFEIVLHDIGKATKYFQAHIQNKTLTPLEKALSFHSLLSAVIAFKYLSERLENPFDALLGFVRIKHHHGDLLDIRYDLNNLSNKQHTALINQINAIPFGQLLASYKPIKAADPSILQGIDKENFLEAIDYFETNIRILRRSFRKKSKAIESISASQKLLNYFRFASRYGLILHCDKLQAAGAIPPNRNDILKIPKRLVAEYKNQQRKNNPKWGSSYLNHLRENAYLEVEQNIEKLLHISENNREEGNIFILQLPTGLGKTMTGFNAAIQLRQYRYEKRGMSPRIIYALPFLTIIDQNFEVIKDIFNSMQLSTRPSHLSYHHHLSVMDFEHPQKEDVYYKKDVSKLLLESWESEIIITTFIQLFNTLVGWRNKDLKRFPLLKNTIIIVDEIQAIPEKYWELIRQVFLCMAKFYGTDIIIMTATQPYIFSKSDPTFSLCDTEKYYHNLNRISIVFHPQEQTIAELIDSFSAEAKKTYLFIVNTIACAKETHQRLANKYPDASIGYLTTQIVMSDRKKRIKKIKRGDYQFVIATQLVEAGVDIDFDIVYRDIAPLDSLNQAAGRCNRNNRYQNHPSTVHIVNLVSEKGKPFASFIYSPVLLSATKQILEKRKSLSENQFLETLDAYYQSVRERTNQSESKNIINAMGNLRFFHESDPDVRHFQLIENRGITLPIFIELNQEAEELWQTYIRIQSSPTLNLFERNNKFLEIKPEFYQYVLTISAERYANIDLPPTRYGFGYVSNVMLSHYYHGIFGYSPDDLDTVLIL